GPCSDPGQPRRLRRALPVPRVLSMTCPLRASRAGSPCRGAPCAAAPSPGIQSRVLMPSVLRMPRYRSVHNYLFWVVTEERAEPTRNQQLPPHLEPRILTVNGYG